ncbi:alpha/beta fold hydrolase [Streptomyces sp. ISL-98]|uniref:alpha/beta fold hydrolase n=1 Tax=Streptomyces sp. ISL-98 TaxID=2819192 RepID=UPI001BE9D8DE|nr:alpha/beta fold hydrolase [Streptomyces sp. ISL-98]MBT2508470.1 alpha/beta fold hydrolase [Streptomyces sp. ISL-98]
MTGMYPPIEPYDEGMLDVGHGSLIHWEVCGNPAGKPALVVHGGPGSGCGPGVRRYFDPDRYRTVLFDQRGCGRSTPHASDPVTDLTNNTTHHLVRDMEQLRDHLAIDRWLLFGGSWGSTLILAYAERHPDRVSEIVISGVTTTRRSEIDWLYGGVARFFPEAWERFRAGVPEKDRDGDLIAAYARLVSHPDPDVRAKATAARLALVRIASHYFSHGAWLEEGELLREAGRLSAIPGVLIHGRHDLSSPHGTAWELARAWPGAELVVVDDAGHKGSESMRELELAALNRFARS